MQKSVMKSEWDKIFDKEKRGLLALIHEAGGEVKGKYRLMLGVYALNNTGLFNYDFKERCEYGPYDKKLHDDINSLVGWVEFGNYRSSSRVISSQDYGSFKIYDAVKEETKDISNEIRSVNPKAHKKLTDVAKMLGSPLKEIPTSKLSDLYAPGLTEINFSGK